jgi:hypothetical protein
MPAIVVANVNGGAPSRYYLLAAQSSLRPSDSTTPAHAGTTFVLLCSIAAASIAASTACSSILCGVLPFAELGNRFSRKEACPEATENADNVLLLDSISYGNQETEDRLRAGRDIL